MFWRNLLPLSCTQKVEVACYAKVSTNLSPLHGVTSHESFPPNSQCHVTLRLLGPSDLLLMALFLFLVNRKDEVAVIRSKFPNKVPVSRNCKTIYRVCHGMFIIFFLLWRCDPTRVMASSFLRFLDHTQRRTTVGRTPLDE